MQRTFRLKLFSIVAVAALGLIAITIAGRVVESRVDEHLSTIREHYIPKIGLADRLKTSFERVSRALQDAAQANDVDVLNDARKKKDALLEELGVAAIDPAVARGVTEYYTSAEAATRSLIRGDTGEGAVEAMQAMQSKQAAVEKSIEDAARFDERGLSAAFAAASDEQSAGTKRRLVVSIACIALVLGLSLWVSRGLYRRLADLVAGFRRFGEGNFTTAIPEQREDELGAVARDANTMSARLGKLVEERDRGAWIKAGQVRLADELRGELAPQDVGRRALEFLASYLEVPIGVVYVIDDDDKLRVLAVRGVEGLDRTQAIEIGEGLVGEAARSTAMTIVRGGKLPVRSGLLDGDLGNVVLVPLVHGESVRGLLELGTATWNTRSEELVMSIRESIAITIDVARGRNATAELLLETQKQATELEEVRRGLEQKAQELVRANAYKSQFLANMSHELRTPLNAILGFSELLHDGAVPADSPQHTEFLQDIITSGRHLLQLINDILDLSKVEAGKLEFSPVQLSMKSTIHEVLGILRTATTTARVSVVADIEGAADHVVLDPGRLKQVLYNFLSNAVKFTPPGGTVTVRVVVENEDAIRIQVTDTGIGIPADALPRLFGEFEQIHNVDGKQRGGTGLGLALTRRLVEAQGGSVGVRSIVGQGSTFHAVLPHNRTPRTVLVLEDDPKNLEELVGTLSAAGYTVDTAQSGAQALAACREHRYDAITIGFAITEILAKPIVGDALKTALARASVARETSATILVVDDDPTAQKLMTTHLGELGYSTRCAFDGAAALVACRAARPAAIVLDLLMPGMSGFEVLDHLHKDRELSTIPVIVWTSKDLTADERALLRASASAVVIKGARPGPSVVDELASLLRREAN